jgi:hypothetical protein
MAGTRYRINGAGTWDDASKWSLTSGGSPYEPVSGVEKITNAADREFNSDTGWILNQSEISNGTLKINTTTGFSECATKVFPFFSAKWYKVTFTIVVATTGSVRFRCGTSGIIFIIPNGITGSYTKYVYGWGNYSTGFYCVGASSGEFDNLSVQEIDNISPDFETDAIFDENSGTGTVTCNAIANMRDLTFTGNSAITIANAGYAFNVFGSFTGSANTTFSFTGTGYFYSKGTGTITQGGATLQWNQLFIDGVGITVTLGADFNNSLGRIEFINGTFNTNNYVFNTIGNSRLVYGITGTARQLILGSSIVTVGGFLIYSSVGIDYGTSKIVIIGDGGIRLSGTAAYDIDCFLANATAFSSTGSMRTLVITPSSGSILAQLRLDAAITVNESLTVLGFNSTNNRLLIYSNTIGTPRTITCNGTIVASNVDFRDITLAGTASADLSAIEGGSGDCGGNTGITFTPSQTQYYKHTGGVTTLWSDATKWFNDLALTTQGRMPLPQDDAVFLADSFSAACTLSVNVPRMGGLNMEAVNQAVTFTLTNAIECYGSYVLGNLITPSGNFSKFMMGRGNFVLNSYNKSQFSFIFNAFGGTYTNLSDITYIGSNTGGFYIGTFYLNGFNLTHSSDAIVISAGFNFYAGSGIISPNRTSVSPITILGNFFPETSTIKFSPISGSADLSISLGGKSFNKVHFSGTLTGNFDISGSNTFNEIIIDAGRKVRITSGTTQTIGKLTAIGTEANPITIGSTVAGSRHNIIYNGVEASTVENCIISDSKVTTARRLLAKNSTNAGNNQNWGFDTLPPLAVNGQQVDRMYVGEQQNFSAYMGSNILFNRNDAEMRVAGTGTFAGVSTLRLQVSADTTVTIVGDASFYSDAAGTLDASKTWTITAGALRTIYLKAPSANSSSLIFPDRRLVINIGTSASGGWDSGANAARLTFAPSEFMNVIQIRMTGNSTIIGALPTVLTYLLLGDFPVWEYSGSLPTGITYLRLLGADQKWSWNGILPVWLTFLQLSGGFINWTALDVSGSGNITTFSLINHRLIKMDDGQLISLFDSMRLRTGSLPATVTIGDYLNYAAPPPNVIAARDLMMAAKGVTTVNLQE